FQPQREVLLGYWKDRVVLSGRLFCRRRSGSGRTSDGTARFCAQRGRNGQQERSKEDAVEDPQRAAIELHHVGDLSRPLRRAQTRGTPQTTKKRSGFVAQAFLVAICAHALT